MPGIELKDTSIIRLRPCRFVKESADRYGVIRRAGTNRVVVRTAGLAACKLFRGGCAINHAKLQLAERFRVAQNTIDLRPLLRSLSNADLIASVDGKPLPEERKPSLVSAYRYYLRFHLGPPLLRIAYGKLPLTLGKKLASWVWRMDRRSVLWPRALDAAEKVASCPPLARRTFGRRRFARRYLSNLVRNWVDFECIASMTPAQAEAWFQAHVDYEGLEHLMALKRERVPIIAAGFHFATTKLIALLLLRRGYDTTQVWVPDSSMDAETRKWLEEFCKLKAGFGNFNNIPGFNLPNYRRLLQSIRDGEVLVWFPDVFTDRRGLDEDKADWRAEAAKVYRISELRTELPQSKIEVELCGRRVFANAWIGGFARLTSAAVVPMALVRDGERLKMILKPALRLVQTASAKDVEDLNRAIFKELDALLRLYSDQWSGWPSLAPAA
jgi:lauroyl/myristoyl acyltransferase